MAEEYGPRAVIKGESATDAESFLRMLCEGTFLSMWSYPNVYRDQGIGEMGEGKELCDLLVVFGEHVIIFSDKHCAFEPKGDDVELAWKRWYKKAVERSAKQAWGAERWIKQYPDRVFLDKKCEKVLPIDLPDPRKMKVHLIVVAHGISEQIEKIFNDTGSLMIKSELVGNDHYEEPFSIGDLDPSKTYVHVMDDYTLQLLMFHRDTAMDFVNYLEKKEKFIRNTPYKLFSSGEEQILAVYLTSVNDEGEHDFVVPKDKDGKKPDSIFLGAGFWEKFVESDARKKQIEYNSVSYLWDALLEKIAHHALTDTQYKSHPLGIKGTEISARIMASETRFRRRALSLSWMDMFEKTKPTQRRLRVHPGKTPDEPSYIFLLFPWPPNIDEESYRQTRADYLTAVCMVARKEYPQLRDVVAIATESDSIDSTRRSEDFGYFDASDWGEEQEKEAARLQQELQILVRPETMYVQSSEYPEQDKRKKHDRNEACPCGSGKKYKKCCIDRTYSW